MSPLLLTISVAIFVGGAFKDFFNALTRSLVTPLIAAFFPSAQESVYGLTIQVGSVKLLIGEVISATVTLLVGMLVVTFTLPYIKAYVPLKGAARG